jgi:hypothetical protein
MALGTVEQSTLVDSQALPVTSVPSAVDKEAGPKL